MLFATAPAIFFIFYIAVEQREAAQKRLAIEARHLAGLASREHAHQLDGAKNLLARLAPAVDCIRWDDGARPGGRGFAGGACPPYLPALLAGYPQFANIGVLSRDGAVACSAVGLRESHDWKGNPAFVRALRSADVEVGSYVVGSIVRRPVLHLALAIRDARATPCAVAFVALDLRWIDRFARQANLPRDNSILITDREGRVLAHSGAVEAPATDSSGPLRVPDFDALQMREGGAVLTIGPVSRLFVVSPMDGVPGVFVVAGLPNERVQSEVNAVFFRALLGLLLITLLTLTAAVLAAEFSVLRVLRALSRTARRFGAGDLNARASLDRTHGEIRELAASFNVMADALAERQRDAVAAEVQLRALSNRLQVARDSEAARIARELHDELGQVLTSLKLDLATFEKWHEQRRSAGDVKQVAAGMGERIDAAIDFVRRVASELRPTVLDRLGLSAAIQGLARAIEEKSGLAVVVDVRDVKEPLAPVVSIALFRIAQEALTNVVRHAAATEVRIDLAGTDDGLWLTIEDDGKGIDEVGATRGHSLGIVGMRERARLVGGDLTVSGDTGRGTTVQVVVPRMPPEIVGVET